MLQHATPQSSPRTGRPRRLAALGAIAALVATGFGAAAAHADDPSVIPDASLAACLNAKIDPSRPADAPITTAELTGIGTNLQCSGPGAITSLTGLDGAAQLRVLGISNVNPGAAHDFSAAGSIDALARLPRLSTLTLTNTGLTDAALAGLAGATGIQTLDIDRNPGVTSLEALRGMTQMRRLTIQHNAVTSLDPVVTMTNLTGLAASNNRISSSLPLTGLTKLRTVGLAANQLTEIDGLTNAAGLTSIWVNENPLGGKIGPLANKPGLIDVNLNDTGVTDLSPLRSAQSITHFQALRNHIVSIEGLHPAPALTAGGVEVLDQTAQGPTQYVPANASEHRIDLTGQVTNRDGTGIAPLPGPTPAPEYPLMTFPVAADAADISYGYLAAPATNDRFSGTIALPVVRSEITNAALPDTTVGAAYADQLAVTDGFVTATYGLGDDAPAWLRIDPATGALSGTATRAGTFPVTVTAADALGNTIVKTLGVTVAALPTGSTPGGTPPGSTATPPATVPPLAGTGAPAGSAAGLLTAAALAALAGGALLLRRQRAN